MCEAKAPPSSRTAWEQFLCVYGPLTRLRCGRRRWLKLGWRFLIRTARCGCVCGWSRQGPRGALSLAFYLQQRRGEVRGLSHCLSIKCRGNDAFTGALCLKCSSGKSSYFWGFKASNSHLLLSCVMCVKSIQVYALCFINYLIFYFNRLIQNYNVNFTKPWWKCKWKLENLLDSFLYTHKTFKTLKEGCQWKSVIVQKGKILMN